MCTLNSFGGDPILPCLFPTSLQHKKNQSLPTFAPSLQNCSNPPLPTFFATVMLSNPSSYLSQLSSTVLPLSLSSFSPFPNLDHICYSGTPVTSGLGGSTHFLHLCSSASKKQIKSSMQLGKLFIRVGIKVTGISGDPKMKPSRRQ